MIALANPPGIRVTGATDYLRQRYGEIHYSFAPQTMTFINVFGAIGVISIKIFWFGPDLILFSIYFVICIDLCLFLEQFKNCSADEDCTDGKICSTGYCRDSKFCPNHMFENSIPYISSTLCIYKYIRLKFIISYRLCNNRCRIFRSSNKNSNCY